MKPRQSQQLLWDSFWLSLILFFYFESLKIALMQYYFKTLMTQNELSCRNPEIPPGASWRVFAPSSTLRRFTCMILLKIDVFSLQSCFWHGDGTCPVELSRMAAISSVGRDTDGWNLGLTHPDTFPKGRKTLNASFSTLRPARGAAWTKEPCTLYAGGCTVCCQLKTCKLGKALSPRGIQAVVMAVSGMELSQVFTLFSEAQKFPFHEKESPICRTELQLNSCVNINNYKVPGVTDAERPSFPHQFAYKPSCKKNWLLPVLM